MTVTLPGTQTGPVTWQDTSQTRFVTAQLTVAARRLEEVGLVAVTTVTGEPGLGKSAVVDRVVDTHYRRRGHRVLQVSLQSTPTPNELATRLLRQLGHTKPAVGYLLREELVDALTGTRSVIVLDESHHLGVGPLRETNLLIDRLPLTDWILIGTADLTHQLDLVPELADRVAIRAHMQALTRSEVLRVMPAAHPLLADTPADLIAWVNDEFAHGRWRPWRDFIAAAAQLAAHGTYTSVDEKLARAAIATCGGRRATGTRTRRRKSA